MSDADVKRTIERLYDEKDALRSQNQALQERAEKAEAVMRKALEQHGDPDISCEGDCWAFAFKQLLSPTQETDPE